MNWPWTPQFPQQPFHQTCNGQPPPPPPQFFAAVPPYPPPFQPFNPAYQQYPQHAPPPPFIQTPPPQRTVPPQRVQSPQRQAPQPQSRESKAKDVSARDLATAHDTARRLGTKLPGDNEGEIQRWVEQRKKNWPSRANVQRKLEREREKAKEREKQRALEKLREYGSSDDQGVEKNDKNCKGKRNRGRGKRRRGRRGKQVSKDLPLAKRRPTLLKMLLKEEIQQERAVLLQAFGYLVTQRRRAESGDRAGAER